MNPKHINKWLIVFITLTTIGCSENNTSNSKTLEDEILNNKESLFYIDVDNYPKNNKNLPIGIFDSGTGGLTVLDAIVNSDQFINSDHTFKLEGDRQRDFDKECFIYLGDKANMPYGEYSGNNKTSLLKEHVIKDMQFLLGNKYYQGSEDKAFKTDKSQIKALVIACNTATAYGKSDIESFMNKSGLGLKVIGVIGAGVRGALETIDKHESSVIGVMATAGTVASNGYPNTIIEEANKIGFPGKLESFQQAGIGLAAAIDGDLDYLNANLSDPRDNYRGPSFTNSNAKINKTILGRYEFEFQNNEILFSGSNEDPSVLQLNSIRNYISYHVISLLEQIKVGNTTNKLKSVILGCTHYPFFMKEFQTEFERAYTYKENGEYVYRDIMERKITLIDPAINTAKELYLHLEESNTFNNGDIKNSEFYISVPNLLNENVVLDENNNFTYDYKYGRNSGVIQEYVKRVPFSRNSISDELIEMLSLQIPYTFELIESFNNENIKTKYLSKEKRISAIE